MMMYSVLSSIFQIPVTLLNVSVGGSKVFHPISEIATPEFFFFNYYLRAAVGKPLGGFLSAFTYIQKNSTKGMMDLGQKTAVVQGIIKV